jgi:cytoskeleton protein RodZ
MKRAGLRQSRVMSNSDDVVAKGDFGAALMQAREAQGFTVEEINMRLKIPKHDIIAIEASDIAALPASTYTRGYLRSYAKFLEISEESVLSLYNKAAPDTQVSDLKPRSDLGDKQNSYAPLIRMATPLLVVVGAVTVLYGIVQYYQDKADVMEDELGSRESSFTGNSLDSPGSNRSGIEQDARLTADGELILEAPNQAEPDVEEVASETESAIAEESVAEEPIQKEPARVTDVNLKQDVLLINAENGSWIEVRDANDDRLFYNMIAKGGSKTLTGQAPFSISMGNARTTKIVINDIAVDTSNFIRSNNTAKFKVSNDKQNIVFH